MPMLKTLIAVTALAVSVPAVADHGRADKVSPDAYELLLENKQVTVLRMVLAPGQADQLHTHEAETVYFERGGKLRIVPDGGTAFEVEVPTGHVMWHDRWSHQVTNVGNTEVVAIIVEAKDALGR